jgi:hypothetical protein
MRHACPGTGDRSAHRRFTGSNIRREMGDRARLSGQLSNAQGKSRNINGNNDRVPEAYEVLGVPRDASVDEIREAYRTLVRFYHPDGHANAPERVQLEATRRMAELNAAYELLLRERPAPTPAPNARQPDPNDRIVEEFVSDMNGFLQEGARVAGASHIQDVWEFEALGCLGDGLSPEDRKRFADWLAWILRRSGWISVETSFSGTFSILVWEVTDGDIFDVGQGDARSAVTRFPHLLRSTSDVEFVMASGSA